MTGPESPTPAGRLRVLSYNLLGKNLSRLHADLYPSVPPPLLAWRRRWEAIRAEIAHLSPDVVCCQEVEGIEEALDDMGQLGYAGRYIRRGAERGDGCATFWRRGALSLVEQRAVPFEALDMRDNAALVLVLRDARGAEARDVVVGNIHVLFNPNRGDVKLAQVRVLMDLVGQMRRARSNCPAIVMGDFNSTPGSPVYAFAQSGRLPLDGLPRRTLSGQTEGSGWPRGVLRRLQPIYRALASLEREESTSVMGGAPHTGPQPPRLLPPPPPPPPRRADAPTGPDPGLAAGLTPPQSGPDAWSEAHLRRTCGASHMAARTVWHGMRGLLRSSYLSVLGEEPLYTTVHGRFVGCVDYIWFSDAGRVAPAPVAPTSSTAAEEEAARVLAEDSLGANIQGAGGDETESEAMGSQAQRLRTPSEGSGLRPLRALLPPPLETLGCGLPNGRWGSDHASLCAEFEMVD